jgi:aspartate aminotransferase-like enzyme
MSYKFYSEKTSFLAIPGPVEIHPEVMQAMNNHLYGHRTTHFRDILIDCEEKFKSTINTKNDVYFLAGSGSLGLHAGITNLVSSEDTVLNLVCGKFGERVEEMAKRFAGNNNTISIEYGKGIRSEDVKIALENNPDTSLVTITHNETSTAVLNPLPEISKIVHDHGALLYSDCITSAGGDEVRMDDWKIDFFVSGSQKCYGLPPGLAFVSFSDEAYEKMQKTTRRQDFYSDMILIKNEMGNKKDTPWTPAVSLMYGLQKSLDLIHEEGVDNRVQRHRKMGQLYRGAMEAIGIKLLAEVGYESNTVTAGYIPEGLDAKKFMKECENLGILFAGGQGTLSGKIWRAGHMNIVGPREILMFVSVVETALSKCEYQYDKGVGVSYIIENL